MVVKADKQKNLLRRVCIRKKAAHEAAFYIRGSETARLDQVPPLYPVFSWP